MSKKKTKYHNPGQLSLFSEFDNFSEDQLKTASKLPKKPPSDKLDNQTKKQIENNQGLGIVESEVDINRLNGQNQRENLFLPFTYEDIVSRLGKNMARLTDLIVPVTEFEEPIIQVASDIDNAGYLLFLYGASGVGKSTFISSLKIQKHIPIQEIISIDATKLTNKTDSKSKLQKLHDEIQEKSRNFFSGNNKKEEKLCIVIEYLENLEDEEQSQIRAFFRDLNRLLRQFAILIIWPITVRTDLESMMKFAQDYSSTIFHRRIPFIEFSGPPVEEYPNIAKKTIICFNSGKSCYEFQLNDQDFEKIKCQYQDKPSDKHLIRDYLKDVKTLWEDRTERISQISKNIPKPTEIWFIFSYPEAEGVVARFTKQTPDIINEMWNADYKSLSAYINDNNQKKADWNPLGRLTIALSSRMLTTKIMYLPTNALVSCIASYAQDANIGITRDDLCDKDKYNVPKQWLGKTASQNTLKRTPLYLQLSGDAITSGKLKSGKRKSGPVKQGLINATQAFKQINEDISKTKTISDQRFNKAIYLALKDVLKETDFNFSCEEQHPYLKTIRPDILVETDKSLICLELCYTIDNTPGTIADYVLRKLHQYMKQMEYHFGINQNNY